MILWKVIQADDGMAREAGLYRQGIAVRAAIEMAKAHPIPMRLRHHAPAVALVVLPYCDQCVATPPCRHLVAAFMPRPDTAHD